MDIRALPTLAEDLASRGHISLARKVISLAKDEACQFLAKDQGVGVSYENDVRTADLVIEAEAFYQNTLNYQCANLLH